MTLGNAGLKAQRVRPAGFWEPHPDPRPVPGASVCDTTAAPTFLLMQRDVKVPLMAETSST